MEGYKPLATKEKGAVTYQGTEIDIDSWQETISSLDVASYRHEGPVLMNFQSSVNSHRAWRQGLQKRPLSRSPPNRTHHDWKITCGLSSRMYIRMYAHEKGKNPVLVFVISV